MNYFILVLYLSKGNLGRDSNSSKHLRHQVSNHMVDKNLIASVALFSELYNSETYKNIPEIIAEFIRGAVVLENKFSFNSTEIKDLLNEVYGFDIPESIIRTTLQNKFKDELRRENNYFHFDQTIKNSHQNINVNFQETSKSQNEIIEDIYRFIEKRSKKILVPSEKENILENLFHFLMDNGYSEKYSDLISAYVLSKEGDSVFRDVLNSIKEGLILYQGINYTADINQLGSWNNDLTIYLATEHLFNALGYNGILYKEIFDDFNKLVFEINNSSKNSGAKRKKIELRYLDETKIEIDNFFQAAESIKKGNRALDPSKLAMETILKKSNRLSDIRTLRVQFDIELKRLGIQYQDISLSIEKLTRYNVVDKGVITELKKQSEEKGRPFNEDTCLYYLQMFTKINALRNGINNNKFEKCGHLYVTETSFVKYLAHNNLVKFKDNDVSFAKDIDFVITKFWFALKKGFSNKQSLPKSFDVVTKAKIILSAHINAGVSKNYENLLSDRKSGKLTDEEAVARSYSLREKPSSPEEVTIDVLDEALDFLQNENYLEDFYREKVRKEQLLEKTQQEKTLLEQKLDSFYHKEQLQKEQQDIVEFENRRNYNSAHKWNDIKTSNNKDLRLLLFIFVLNAILLASAFIITVSKDVKEWFAKFGLYQILLISLYISIILFDTLGSKYLFKKERILNGWNWLKSLLRFSEVKTEALERLNNEYVE